MSDQPYINEHHYASLLFNKGYISLKVICEAPDGYLCDPHQDMRAEKAGQQYCQVTDSWENLNIEMFSEDRQIILNGDTSRIPLEYFVEGWGENFEDWIRFKVGRHVWDDNGIERILMVHDLGAESAAIEAGG